MSNPYEAAQHIAALNNASRIPDSDQWVRWLKSKLREATKRIDELESENKQLRSDKLENPWCASCKEPDCIVSIDGTCEMIRKYLKSLNR